MLTYEQILELMERFEASELNVLELRDDDFRLRLERGAEERSNAIDPATAALLAQTAVLQSAGPDQRSADEASGSRKTQTEHRREDEPRAGFWVESPIVGTFYAAPSPEAPPFVSVGDRVERGQTICIVEAMKMMNEIEAEVAGEVLEITAVNGEPIGHGDPILRLRPDEEQTT